MKQIQLGTSPLMVPQVVVGCMRMADRTTAQIEKLVRTAMEHGANYFDHADIYGGGACESLFSKGLGLTPALREKMVLQSKCGICPGVMYDFSKEHILSSVDGILKRLNTEYLDVLLLHRPDMLMEPEEVAEAFDRLEASGKVRFFDSFYTMMLTHKEVIIKYFLRIWHKFVICIKIQFVFLL